MSETIETKRSRWTFRIVLVVNLLALLVVSGIRPNRSPRELEVIYTNRDSRFTEIEGVRTHYRIEGRGEPLLLIHGTSSSLHTWDGWVREMRSTRQIVRLDLPGYGLTGPAPDRDYSAERYARFVAAFLEKLGLERVDVAGNSLGGRVALVLTLRHPEKVRKLILVDAAGLSGQERPFVFRLAGIPGLGFLITVFSPEWLVRSQLERVYGDDSRLTEAVVRRHYALLRRTGNRQAIRDRFAGPPDPDLDREIGSIAQPTLIEWGSADPWIPLSFANRLHAGIPGSILRVYDGAGHVPMEERPEETAADASAFLSGTLAPAR